MTLNEYREVLDATRPNSGRGRSLAGVDVRTQSLGQTWTRSCSTYSPPSPKRSGR
jgi:hypothetical protein